MSNLADLSLYIKSGNSEIFFKAGIKRFLEFNNIISPKAEPTFPEPSIDIEAIKKTAASVAQDMTNYWNKSSSICSRILDLGILNTKGKNIDEHTDNTKKVADNISNFDPLNFNPLTFNLKNYDITKPAKTSEEDYEPEIGE